MLKEHERSLKTEAMARHEQKDVDQGKIPGCSSSSSSSSSSESEEEAIQGQMLGVGVWGGCGLFSSMQHVCVQWHCTHLVRHDSNLDQTPCNKNNVNMH
jgi:hypothetical protein